MKKVAVLGGGGFIGHHLIKYLKAKGYWVRGVDLVKSPFLKEEDYDEFKILDLKDFRNTVKAIKNVDEVYQLAAENGSIEYTTLTRGKIIHNSAKINLNVAEACRINGIKKVLFTSSSCVYPEDKQQDLSCYPLKEEDAYPASPDTEYGWEKLFSERVYKSYEADFGLKPRIVRYFNIYGQEGHYDPVKAKAPTSLSRKMIKAEENNNKVFIWGDGKQIRSFCYITDCLDATYKLMNSDINVPVNIGTTDLYSIDKLVDLLADIAGKKIEKVHQLDKVQGTRSRNCDLTRAKEKLKWEAKIKMREGLEKTYNWIKEDIENEN